MKDTAITLRNRLSRKLFLISFLTISITNIFGQSGWSFNPGLYAYDMEVNASVTFQGAIADTGQLAAFVGDEIRGLVDSTLNMTGTDYFSIRVYSDSASGEEVTFRFYDIGTDQIYDISETVTFVNAVVLGDALVPLDFNAIVDDVLPTVTTCPSDISTANDPGACEAVVNYTEPVFEDNVDGTGLSGTRTEGPASGATFPLGTTTVTYEYYDAAGNGPATCTFTVTVTDTEDPVPDVSPLPDINAECEVTSLTAPTATDNCAGTVTVSHDATLPINTQGTTVVTWTYDDGNGNTVTQTQDVVIDDVTDPVPDVDPLPDVTAECEVTSLTAPTATDNCAGVIEATHNATLPINTQGTTTVTWTYDDGNGNTVTQTQDVVIDDVTDPVPDVDPLPDVTAECEVTSLTAPTATDNCAGVIEATHNATLPINTQGTTTVTWTYDDGNGNTVTQTQDVVINDVTDPVPDVDPLPDVTAECEVTSLTAPTATDNCAGVIEATHSATLPINTQGTTTVTWTYDDGNGNTVNQTQDVVIDDVTDPVPDVDPLPDVTAECEVTSLTAPTATDNCAGVIEATHNATLPINTQGTTTVTWTYDDGNGNTVTQTQDVVIEDVSPPTVTDCPTDITINNDAGICGAVVNYTAPVFADNCDGTGLSGIMTQGLASGTEFPVGVTTVTYTYTDDAGNGPVECTFAVTVVDNEDPEITAPSNVTVFTDAGQCSATGVALGTPTTSDNCTVADVSNDAVEPFALGATTVTWTVTDGSGNTATATQTVTVVDNEDPEITAPVDVTVFTDAGQCSATGVTLGTPTTSDNCTVADVSNDAVEPFALGATTVTWTVTDGSGNTATATQTVTVVDNEDPEITAPADVTVFTDAGQCSATGVTLGTPTTSDNCTVADVSNDAVEPFALGATTVTWTVTDGSGNTATATQTVTVVDNEDPEITAPSNVTVFNDVGQCSATGVTLGTPTTSDNCTVADVSNDAVEPFALGSTTVTWTVTDGAGNTATATQTVTVVDNEDPEITAPADVTVFTDAGQCSATGVTLGTPTTSDNCTVADVSNDAVEPFALGSTTVTWTVTDGAGNTATATQTVTVVDNEDPEITAPADVTVFTDAGQCSATGVTLGTPTTSDNCTVADVSNDAVEPFALGATTVTWTVTDGSGNTATATQIVTVVDNEDPQITAPADLILDNDPGSCDRDADNIVLGSPVTTDNCGIAAVVNDAPAVFPLGNTTVTWTVTDVNGNTAQATQLVTIEDNELPVASVCPADIVVSNDAGSCDAIVTYAVPEFTDNCDGPGLSGTLTEGLPSGSTFPEGTTTVTYSYTDAAGNGPVTCSFTITVNDTEPPTITAPVDVTVDSDPGSCDTDASGVTLGTPVTADNCGVSSVVNDAPAVYPLGVTIVTWTVTDIHGNSSEATQTVIVEDNEDPVVVTCPADITVNNDVGLLGAIITYDIPTFADNCDGNLLTGTMTAGLASGSEFPIGTTTVTYEYTDAASNGPAICTFDVTVNYINRPPTVDNPFPDVQLDEGFSTYDIPLAGVFGDTDTWDELTYTATSSNNAVVTVDVINNTTLRLNEGNIGITNITVTATDDGTPVLSVSDVFEVDVNGSPFVSDPADDLFADAGFGNILLDMNAYFSDPESDNLTYTAISQNTDIVTTSVNANILTITYVDFGVTEIVITANDGSTLSATETMAVDVNGPPYIATPLGDLSIDEGFGTTTLDIAGTFADPEGDLMTYSANTSNISVALAGMNGTILTLTEAGPGIANVRVTANDGSTLRTTEIFEIDINGGPVVSDPIPDFSRDAGFGTIILDLNSYFEDPEGDGLTYSANSDNTGVVTTSVSNNVLTISDAGYGVANVTVTASDGSTLEADDIFLVDVNGAPVVTDGIDDVALDEGFGIHTINLAGAFSDPEDDALSFTAASDDVSVVIAGVSGNTLTLTEVGHGIANVIVTARDGSTLSVQDGFEVDVNGGPEVAAGLNNISYDEGFGTAVIELDGVFSDPEDDVLSYDVVSSDETVVTTSVTGSQLTLTEVGHGTSTVTVTASDGSSLTVDELFTVDVNGAPVVAAGLPDLSRDEGFGSVVISLAGVFSDPESDPLSYTAASLDGSVVTVGITGGNNLNITEVSFGITEVVVTADDGSSLSVSDTMTVDINGSPVITGTPLADLQLDEGFGTRQVDLLAGFSDPEGDELSFVATSGNTGVVTLSVSDNLLMITEAGPGQSVITVTVDDGSTLSESDQFEVDVNASPVVSDGLSDVALNEGFGSTTVDLSDAFSDPDADPLSYTAVSADEGVVTVSITGDVLTIIEENHGVTNITVTASDGSTLSASTGFSVDVNGAPDVQSPVTDQVFVTGFGSATVDISGVFTDPEGDLMTYSIVNNNPTAVNATLDGTTITLTEVKYGTAAITITASDGELETDDIFSVTVNVIFPADWSYNPADYDFNGQITAQVFIDRDTVESGFLGAFVDGECRGVIDPVYFAIEDRYVFNLIMYSDIAAGEQMHFRYYDYINGEEYVLYDTVAFTSDMIVGDARNPVRLHYYIDFEKSFVSGWNWFSININALDMGLDAVMPGCVVQGDYIKSQTQSATYYDDYGWFGGLEELDPTKLYKTYINSECDISTFGNSVDLAQTSIPMAAGWNWIGYMPGDTLPLADALGSLVLSDLDYIKNQTASSTYYDGFGWFGGLKSMAPKEGYMVRLANQSSLVYPESTSKKAYFTLKNDPVPAGVEPSAYEFSGTVTARVFMNGEAIGSDEDLLMAYVDDECRGIIPGSYFDPAAAFAYQLMIYSNVTEGEEVSFRYYHAGTDKTYRCIETLEFRNDMIVADAFDAFELNLDAASGVEDILDDSDMILKAYPNPFRSILRIDISVPSTTNMILEVYDLTGRKIRILEKRQLMPGTYSVEWNAEGLPGGTYLLKAASDEEQIIRKVTLID